LNFQIIGEYPVSLMLNRFALSILACVCWPGLFSLAQVGHGDAGGTPPRNATIAAPPEAVPAARALIARVLPAHANDFVCEIIPADEGRDVFELSERGGKILLRGNSGVSLSMAFNWYLRYEAKTSYDWQADRPLEIAGRLPAPSKATRRVCSARERFFLNYCTYGYTFPFTNLQGWQRFIDWMAMNGVNRPLMQCGQEAVWLEVWKSYGLTDAEIRGYFTGPAHLPWHRMANIDHFDGPLAASYITGQMEMQKKLLIQARALGMKPVLSGFAGHVPQELKRVKPEATITQIKPGWGGMSAREATWFLSPTDPLFKEVQGRFLAAQAKLYGTDHLYAADPFNEIDPPSWEPAYMASVAKSIYEGMSAADPAAIWYQMTWTFYFDHHWQKKSADGQTPLRALCESVPKGRMVLIDYVCEEQEFYRQTESFYGATFLWDYIGNYGGCTYFRAPIHQVSQKIAKALPVANCAGVGCALEGLNPNPVIYEMILEQPWAPGGALDDNQWIQDYADRRAGRKDASVERAWSILLDKVLNKGPQGHHDRGSAITARPPDKGASKEAPAPKTALAGEVHGRPPELLHGLVEALDALFKAAPESQRADGYSYDAVNFTRQALAYYSDNVRARIDDANKRNDLPELERQAKIILAIIKDMDDLVGTRQEYLLGRWLRDARSWGANPTEADAYEHNARLLITAWGGGLRDYAHREWNGLLRDYYLPRWRAWAAKNAPGAIAGPLPAQNEFLNTKGNGYAIEPTGKPVETAQRIFAKYRDEMLK
jgi:alpha-N-acetylglucosaminidase